MKGPWEASSRGWRDQGSGQKVFQGDAQSIPPSEPLMISAPAGAVASSVVKQKLAEVILKKQQAALERTVHPNSPSVPYRLTPSPPRPLASLPRPPPDVRQ